MSTQNAIEKSTFITLSEAIAGLEDELKEFFLSNAFDNKYTVHPRRFGELSREECAAFLRFLESGDERGAPERGKKLAMEGVGVKIALGIASRVRLFSARILLANGQKGFSAALEAVDSYTSAFLAGFMEGYEEKLLLEQERIRRALAAAQGADGSKAPE